MGLGSGRHHIGDMDVVIEGERALIEGTDTLCGSIVTMDGCIRHFMHSAREYCVPAPAPSRPAPPRSGVPPPLPYPATAHFRCFSWSH